MKTVQAGGPVELSFRNASTVSRRLYWLDPDGGRKFVGLVAPNTLFRQATNVGHAWIVTDEAEKCVNAIVAAETATFDVGAQQIVMAPTPGVAQPLAPAPVPVSPPVAGQSAPVASVMAPQVIPAPEPQSVEIPNVSPVEQFQLTGNYRFVPRADDTRALNTLSSGSLEIVQVKPQWDSGQWAFEPVAETPFVRIKNLWKKTYLADVDGKLRAVAAPSNAPESHWSFEPVDGTSFVQFRNRETDRFLLSSDKAPLLADEYRQDQENQSQWAMAPGGRPVAAAAPRNSAYDSALADCRQMGGVWTGSSCRAPMLAQSMMPEPLSCRPGWAWTPEFGECVWDGGGRCPPWQVGPGGACMSDLACRGGRVRMSGRGYPVCDCPIGAVTYGNYPNLSCVPSIARTASVLMGALLGGNAPREGFGGGQGRIRNGQAFGNNQFGNGQTWNGRFGPGKNGGTVQFSGTQPTGNTVTTSNVETGQVIDLKGNTALTTRRGTVLTREQYDRLTKGGTQTTTPNTAGATNPIGGGTGAAGTTPTGTGQTVVVNPTGAGQTGNANTVTAISTSGNWATQAKTDVNDPSLRPETRAVLQKYLKDPTVPLNNYTPAEAAALLSYTASVRKPDAYTKPSTRSEAEKAADAAALKNVSPGFLDALRRNPQVVTTTPAEKAVKDIYLSGAGKTLFNHELDPAERDLLATFAKPTAAEIKKEADAQQLVKNFGTFDQKTKDSMLSSCLKTPAEPSCNALLVSQNKLTGGQQAAVFSCKTNPSLDGCDQVLLGSGIEPRKLEVPTAVTTTTPDTKTTTTTTAVTNPTTTTNPATATTTTNVDPLVAFCKSNADNAACASRNGVLTPEQVAQKLKDNNRTEAQKTTDALAAAEKANAGHPSIQRTKTYNDSVDQIQKSVSSDPAAKAVFDQNCAKKPNDPLCTTVRQGIAKDNAIKANPDAAISKAAADKAKADAAIAAADAKLKNAQGQTGNFAKNAATQAQAERDAAIKAAAAADADLKKAQTIKQGGAATANANTTAPSGTRLAPNPALSKAAVDKALADKALADKALADKAAADKAARDMKVSVKPNPAVNTTTTNPTTNPVGGAQNGVAVRTNPTGAATANANTTPPSGTGLAPNPALSKAAVDKALADKAAADKAARDMKVSVKPNPAVNTTTTNPTTNPVSGTQNGVAVRTNPTGAAPTANNPNPTNANPADAQTKAAVQAAAQAAQAKAAAEAQAKAAADAKAKAAAQGAAQATQAAQAAQAKAAAEAQAKAAQAAQAQARAKAEAQAKAAQAQAAQAAQAKAAQAQAAAAAQAKAAQAKAAQAAEAQARAAAEAKAKAAQAAQARNASCPPPKRPNGAGGCI